MTKITPTRDSSRNDSSHVSACYYSVGVGGPGLVVVVVATVVVIFCWCWRLPEAKQWCIHSRADWMVSAGSPGRYFVLEHPSTASSWGDAFMMQVQSMPGSEAFVSDKSLCDRSGGRTRLGARDRSSGNQWPLDGWPVQGASGGRCTGHRLPKRNAPQVSTMAPFIVPKDPGQKQTILARKGCGRKGCAQGLPKVARKVKEEFMKNHNGA